MAAVEGSGVASAGHPRTSAADTSQEKWDPRSVQEKWLAKWDAMGAVPGQR